jgi:purine-nucleoside phosphorylase
MHINKIALILGTGWNEVVDHLKVDRKVSFEKYFGRKAGVQGHRGQVVFGTISGKRVLCFAGRFHTYEGYSSFDATLPVRKAKEEGADTIILTSASGALNKDYKVGDIVVLTDTLNLLLQSPLQSGQFQDLSNMFDIKMREKAIAVCKKEKIPLRQGVYAYVRGPHFESFADKKALAVLGADVVGMSTAPEAIMARQLGMKVLGLSCVTNLAFVKHSHEEVLSSSKRASADMVRLLEKLIKNL